MNIYEKLSNIQNELKCNKSQYNSFGKYKYRSCEDILEALKPICKKYGTVLVLSDTLENIGDRYYIKATAILHDITDTSSVLTQDASSISIVSEETKISNTAYAREEEEKKGMDGSQITGTASSYARKYALNGLFNIDDTKDADTDEYTKQTQEDNGEKRITKTQADALFELAKNRGIEKDDMIVALKDEGYNSFYEIKVKDYNVLKTYFEKSGRN